VEIFVCVKYVSRLIYQRYLFHGRVEKSIIHEETMGLSQALGRS
jgi:hypothetical protein